LPLYPSLHLFGGIFAACVFLAVRYNDEQYLLGAVGVCRILLCIADFMDCRPMASSSAVEPPT
jgi:hypothetical protein